MEQITIVKPNEDEIDLMRTSPVINILSAVHKSELMQGEICLIEFESEEILDIDIQDKITVFGQQYKLNELPSITKNSKNWFVYNCIFEGSTYDLLKVSFRNADVSGGSFSSVFSITGNLFDIASILITNLNRVYPTKWVLIGYPITDVRTLDFSKENCLEALLKLCNEYGYEFQIIQGGEMRYLNILQLGNILPYKYEYGVGKSLYSITREKVDNKNLVTRLYAFGSDKNLTSSYRNFSTHLKFSDDGYIENTDAIAQFGLIEADKEFDIFPSRKGKITAVYANKKEFYDSDMFDLNETDANGTKWLIAGTTAKISMLTGKLAGYEFTISSYNHPLKKFIINEYKDDRGEIFPSETVSAFQLEVGDEYTILDIRLPESYIIDAETQLRAKAQEYLYNNSQPVVKYSVLLDEQFLEIGTPDYGEPDPNLPEGWVHTNIGSLSFGFSQYVNGFKIIGGSDDESEICFLHRGLEVEGNSLSGILKLAPWIFGTQEELPPTVQFGLMVRFGLDVGSKFVAIKIEDANYSVIFRDAVNGIIQSSGDSFPFDPVKKYGIDVELQTLFINVNCVKYALNVLRQVFNYIYYAATEPEIEAVRIGYFLGNTDGLKAVLNINNIGSVPQVPVVPNTDLGEYSYININNGNIGKGEFSNDKYILKNAGLDVWGTEDKFGYLFFELDDATAKITANLIQEPNYLSLLATPLDDFARCGLMWRLENTTSSKFVAINQNQDGTIFISERYGDSPSVNILGSPITDKTDIHDFYIEVSAGDLINDYRVMNIKMGYIEEGEEVQIASISHEIDAGDYADSKLGVFQTSKSDTLQAYLNAKIAINDVGNSNNPCGKPGSPALFSDDCVYEWGQLIYT